MSRCVRELMDADRRLMVGGISPLCGWNVVGRVLLLFFFFFPFSFFRLLFGLVGPYRIVSLVVYFFDPWVLGGFVPAGLLRLGPSCHHAH